MKVFHHIQSLWHSIPQGGPLNVFVHAMNVSMFVYILCRIVFAWRHPLRMPRSSVLFILALVPILLSTTLAIIYLSELPTYEQFRTTLETMRVKAASASLWDDNNCGIAIVLVDIVRLDLYSGLLFTSLSLFAIYIARLTKSPTRAGDRG